MKIPFIRRTAVRVLGATYPSHEVAELEIDRSIRGAVDASLLGAFEEADLRRAIGVTQAIYRHNVFPAMKVAWGTYANHSGHTTSNGCFRCHDGNHKTRDGLVIRHGEMCHTIE